MKWQSLLAIYALFWVLSAFVVLPFGLRTHEEAGIERVAGQADSAPHEWRPWRVAGRITAVATALFALFVANYLYGWVDAQSLDVFTPRPST